MRNRKGFILYIVVTILLGLAILAFALNDFKRGAVTQLAKNIDQNRLIQLCKSSNNETLAYIRSRVNEKGKNETNPVYDTFREVFQHETFEPIPLPNYEPEITIQMAKDSGYDIVIENHAEVRSYKEAGPKAVLAYNAYLDIYSKAYREGAPETAIEVSERHDVRLVDLRHYLDKYVLFVKNYSHSLNNTQRKIVINGINIPEDYRISRVYLGNINYPKPYYSGDVDNQKVILDLDYDYVHEMPGFKSIFGGNTALTTLSGENSPKVFYKKRIKFSDFNSNQENLPMSYFFQVQEIIDVYETFVNQCAKACFGDDGQQHPNKTGQELKDKCDQAMKSPNTNENAAVYKVCKDYSQNFRAPNDYSNCVNFRTILQTCMDNWIYEYGYLDASNIWKFDNYERSLNEFVSPRVQDQFENTHHNPYIGLTKPSEDKMADGYKYCTYPYNYLLGKNPTDDSGTKCYNKERCNVGEMLYLYGDPEESSKRIPVLVEGPVYLRFFKIAFFNRFTTQIHLLNYAPSYPVYDVPILFRRDDRSNTYENKKLNVNDSLFSANPSCFIDRSLMSKAIDTIPINALIINCNGAVKYYNGKGDKKTLTHEEVFSSLNPFLLPASKSNSLAYGFRREIAKDNDVSYTYSNSTKFIADRVKNGILYVDGIMFVEKGDIDLSEVNMFQGKGLVYLQQGNLTLGNLKKSDNERYKDSVRFYLRDGKIKLNTLGAEGIEIEASLAALSYDNGNLNGTIDLGNNKRVKIYGNLLVDNLETIGSKGLAESGTLIVEHNPLIMEPGAETGDGPLDPFQVSIGKVKTSFSIKAGGFDN